MKVLTLTQPWATLVAIGAKRIETRGWRTNYRGPLAIHAAKTFPWDAQTFANVDRHCNPALKAGLLRHPGQMRAGRHPLADRDVCASDLPTGAIVAVCELKSIARIDYFKADPDAIYQPDWEGPFLNFGIGGQSLPDEPERSFGDYSVGRYAWLLSDIRALPEPIPAKGALGLWDYDGELGL